MSGVVWMCASVNLSYLRLSVRRLEQEIAEPCCRGHGPLTKTKRKCGPFQFCFNTTNQHCSSVASGHRHGGPQHLTTRLAAWKLTEMNRMARHLDAYSTRKDGRWCHGEHSQHMQEERKDGRWCRGEHCQHVQEERKDGRWCRGEHSQHKQEERKDGRWCRGEHCQHVQEERKDGRWCRGEHCQHVQEERKDGRWCRGEHCQHVQEESEYLLHYIMCTLFWNSMLNFFFFPCQPKPVCCQPFSCLLPTNL
ncbi:uncharacterized protein LOC135101299 isoform X3 [Scylla paramamosain]|uniref:uncharacterized protein LOC135101299 isoform X3 n=1 Tax=Scylla paramamosain TaxID=85552 RepID=UPI003083A34E